MNITDLSFKPSTLHLLLTVYCVNKRASSIRLWLQVLLEEG